MRVYDRGIARDSGIMNVVVVLKEIGLSFAEIVNKVAEQFGLFNEISCTNSVLNSGIDIRMAEEAADLRSLPFNLPYILCW